ncbi:hypothetical protein [Halobacteriovorax sp.]|uniref:hypothetical protein n=1 Tax=Halobacteriovorax sp. TaxID=2020862 RepID=UPI00356A4FC2
MKQLGIFLILIITLTSCGSLTKFIEQQGKLSSAVKTKTYNISLKEAKERVVKSFSGWRSVEPGKNARYIREEIDKGFVYKKQYFQKYEPGLFELFTALSSSEKDSVEKYFTKNDYHTLEDTSTSFKLIFGGVLYQGKKIASNQVKIEAYSFNQLERGPIELNVNWTAFLTKHQSLFSLSEGKVLLDDSMKHSRRNELVEIDLLKTLDPIGYKKIIQ